MKLRTMNYFVKEGAGNVTRNRVMTFASVTSVIAALLVIGIFFCLMINVNYLADNIESQVQMVVELDENLSPNLITGIEKEIYTLNGVKEVTFVSKAQALEEMKKAMGASKDVLAGLEDDNPLPDTFKVSLKDPRMAASVALALGSVNKVVKVTYGQDELNKILKLMYVLRISSLIIIGVLTFIAIFIISNTIKLTVYARRKEIGIMKYVGATDSFVRAPFLVEGVIIGVLGGLLSSGFLLIGYYNLDKFIKNQMFGLFKISILPMASVFTSLTLLLVTAGIIIGAIGSMISVRRFIKV